MWKSASGIYSLINIHRYIMDFALCDEGKQQQQQKQKHRRRSARHDDGCGKNIDSGNCAIFAMLRDCVWFENVSVSAIFSMFRPMLISYFFSVRSLVDYRSIVDAMSASWRRSVSPNCRAVLKTIHWQRDSRDGRNVLAHDMYFGTDSVGLFCSHVFSVSFLFILSFFLFTTSKWLTTVATDAHSYRYTMFFSPFPIFLVCHFFLYHSIGVLHSWSQRKRCH